MGAFSGLVSNAVDAFSADKQSSKTTLQSFLDKFSNSSGRYVDTIDPLGTFDVKFRFHPTLTFQELQKRNKDSSKLGSALGRVGSSLVNSVVSMAESAADNLTGGIYSSLKNSGSSIKDAHDNFKEVGRHTFMEYLAQANLLQGGEQWENSDQANCPLDLNLGPYVQNIHGLMLKMGGEGKTTTMLGEFPVNGTYVQADGSLQMSIINTKAALHERIFYPWLREVTLPFWSYESQPYTTATVDIDFTKHNDVHYIFCGVRPTSIKLLEANQSADSSNLEREVTFLYDFMFITSDFAVIDSVGNKLMDTAGSLLGGAGKMLNL